MATSILVIGTIGLAGSQGALSERAQGLTASTTSGSHFLGLTRSESVPACQDQPCRFFKRHAGYYRRKMVQWRGYAKRLRAAGGQSRSRAPGRYHDGGSSPAAIICRVFGSHCREAQRVAWCESRYNVHATNGEYWGLFQFGSFARAHYGFAWDALTQARAAYRYFLDAGWAPWSCA